MLLNLRRYSTSPESTLGILHIDGEFAAHCLEDTRRAVKISGETRIPAGNYQIQLRDEGGMTKKYRARYGDMHKGMLWLQDVPNFKYVYIHTGNTRAHTEGCILVGQTASNNKVGKGVVSSSREAYKAIYPVITGAIERGDPVWINIENLG